MELVYEVVCRVWESCCVKAADNAREALDVPADAFFEGCDVVFASGVSLVRGGGSFLVPFGGVYMVVGDELAHFSFVDDLVVDGAWVFGYLGGSEFHFYGCHVFGVFSTYLIE